ncbi:uncharacterized protein LOC116793153 isoform X2 [Chiroxiphia lanceolata]|uniref:uncharacterized protein LOC116793153 isoform X2 n=1 Tax=Chiroxiphia lanceolata TaxID=296741 RepID=UPI0013CECEF6|nr:uncharacterized protein LOC116793153 isoform X2 [Chiroxiphia lanceolata]
MVLPVIIPLGSGLTPAGIGFNPSRSPPAAPPTAAARSLENRGNQALFRPGPRCAATLRLQPRGWHGGDSGSTRAWGLTQISLSKNGRSPWVYASPLPGPAGPCGEDLAYLGLGSVPGFCKSWLLLLGVARTKVPATTEFTHQAEPYMGLMDNCYKDLTKTKNNPHASSYSSEDTNRCLWILIDDYR